MSRLEQTSSDIHLTPSSQYSTIETHLQMTVRMTIGQQRWPVFSLAAVRPKAMLPEVATFGANSLLEISYFCTRSLSEG